MAYTTWRYNKTTHSVDEQPIMEEPNPILYLGISLTYKVDLAKYDEYIASLLHIPVHGKTDWKDEEDVTGKFRVDGGAEHSAIPIKQEQPNVKPCNHKWITICDKCGKSKPMNF